jgi:hypothetical protein
VLLPFCIQELIQPREDEIGAKGRGVLSHSLESRLLGFKSHEEIGKKLFVCLSMQLNLVIPYEKPHIFSHSDPKP